ncbi:hypothetical protein IQ272_11430 [Chroococcidiopsidales cyanobacterium LEGE 13417]|uniref:hypothetical protein n=1 Tax=Chroococcidiopsis sp. CCALA 051 TaxID=869949 RepID=UPI001304DC7D|nr:hypothetical protein [Chroococcidiopsis sp. CCALA 051]MBE9016737.1 hypothetical protein [Chroococcidiopsidales cyanobacterium LEGE 13417]
MNSITCSKDRLSWVWLAIEQFSLNTRKSQFFGRSRMGSIYCVPPAVASPLLSIN